MSDVLVKYIEHRVQNIGHVRMSDDCSYSLHRETQLNSKVEMSWLGLFQI